MKLPKDLAVSQQAITIMSAYQNVAQQVDQLLKRGVGEITPEELKAGLGNKFVLIEEVTAKILAD